MINAIEIALQAARQAVEEQSARMRSELSAVADAINAAKVHFSAEMAAVSKLRHTADARQQEAVRVMDMEVTNLLSVIIALDSQIKAGEIVTGTPVPASKQITTNSHTHKTN